MFDTGSVRLILLLLLQVMKPAHVVHVHSQLPLIMVALGSSGEYVLSARTGTWQLYIDPGSDPTYLKWSANVPEPFAMELDSWREEGVELTYMALSKTRGVFDGTALAKNSNGDIFDFTVPRATCSFSGTKQVPAAEDSLSAVIGAGIEDIKKLFYAPDHGWYTEAETCDNDGNVDTVHGWRRLPESLDAALTQYHDAYRGVSWLSVGTGGEWFVKYKAGFYQWYGLHPMLDHLLRKGHDKRGEPDWVELGHEKTFVAQFEKCTAWYAEEELSEVLLSIASF